MQKLMKQLVPYFTGFVLLITSIVAEAVPIPIFNTGVDALGTVIATGLDDSHFTVLETGNAAKVMDAHPAWIPNNSTSKWIWENASGTPTNVIRTFRTTIDLTGLDPLSASILGRWSTDNSGLDILINGVSTGSIQFGFNVWNNFALTSNFVSGLNTIDFRVSDVGVIAGFRAEFTSATANLTSVPEPGTIALLALGLAGLGCARRQRIATA